MAERRHPPAWFTRWYMRRIAGRYCPCEWPIKSKRLIRWCARIDDENERLDFIRFAVFHMSQNVTVSLSNAGGIRFWRVRHNGSKVER